MGRAYSALVLFVVLVFGMFVAFPVDDLPDTAYDESESLPFENAPAALTAASETLAMAPAEPLDRVESPEAYRKSTDGGRACDQAGDCGLAHLPNLGYSLRC